MPAMQNACTVRLDPDDTAKLKRAAEDYGVSVHAMARLIIQNYLAGWEGPYIVRRPLSGD